MAGEPTLQEGISSEWVQYLQRLLAPLGYWNGGDDGSFTPELTDAVRQFQSNAGVEPSGVVDDATWAALTGTGAGGGADGGSSGGGAADAGYEQPDGGTPDAGYDQPDAGVPDSELGGGGGSMSSTGAQASEVPMSQQFGGFPAFTFTLPTIPVAEADFDTGQAAVHLELSLSGAVQVTFPNPPPGVSLDPEAGWKVEATNAVGGINAGLSVSGIGGESPAIACSYGTEYATYELGFEPPNTLKYSGQAKIAYTVDGSFGPVAVEGQPGFELKATIVPHPNAEAPVPEAEPVDFHSYVQVNETAVAGVIVVTVVVAAAILLAPETGGASLLLLAGA